ncbi:MAG: hypothetical protein ACPG32_10335 [Akkermansiaceae bacterium]
MNKLPLTLLSAACLALSSCDKDSAENAGNNLGQAVTDFTSGVGKGVDEKMSVNVTLSDELKNKGLSHTTAKGLGLGTSGITVYIIAKEEIKTSLIAKALNEDGQEIGRATTAVMFTADDAQYIKFNFNEEMDQQLVAKYTISEKK